MRAILASRMLFVVLMVGVATVTAYAMVAEQASGVGADQGDVTTVEVDYAFNVEDEKKLVGFATDVFFGRVVEQVGSEGIPTSVPGATVKQTQFSVAVGVSIKGMLLGTVTVN